MRGITRLDRAQLGRDGLLFVGQTLRLVHPPARTPAQHFAVQRQGQAVLEMLSTTAHGAHQGIVASAPLVASSLWHVLAVVLSEAVDEDPAGRISWGVAEQPLVDDEARRPEIGHNLAAARVVAIESLADTDGDGGPRRRR
jgi:hypothetical protein